MNAPIIQRKKESPIPRRKLVWWSIAAVALALWTVYSHWRWLQPRPAMHGLVAFFLGLLLLILGQGAVRLIAGTFKNGLRWLWSREVFRLLGWTVLFAVSTVILFYSIELWRGKRAWAKVVENAKAQGATLDLKTILPEPVPDEQNVARAPLFAPFHAASASPGKSVLRDDGPFALFAEWERCVWRGETKQAAWLDQEPTDFRPWLVWLQTNAPAKNSDAERLNLGVLELDSSKAAKQVLTLLPLEAELNDLHEYSSRPYCRFPLDYTRQMWTGNRGMPLLNGFTRILRLRASARLATGQADAAFADVQFAFRLVDYARQQPWVGTSERRLKILADTLQPVWEGLQARRWSESQLSTLQSQLESLDLLADYPAAIQVGAFAMADVYESIVPTVGRKQPVSLLELSKEDAAGLRLMRLIYPTGWSLQNQAAIHQERLRTLDSFSNTVSRGTVPTPQTGLALLRSSSDPFFPVFTVPRVVEMMHDSRWFIFAQSVVNEASLACALERYRLANGEYPETLDAVAPRFATSVPRDIITGGPLKYRRTAGGQFLLYSVGFNKADDEGKPAPREKDWQGQPHLMPELRKNDWVWAYPAQ